MKTGEGLSVEIVVSWVASIMENKVKVLKKALKRVAVRVDLGVSPKHVVTIEVTKDMEEEW